MICTNIIEKNIFIFTHQLKESFKSEKQSSDFNVTLYLHILETRFTPQCWRRRYIEKTERNLLPLRWKYGERTCHFTPKSHQGRWKQMMREIERKCRSKKNKKLSYVWFQGKKITKNAGKRKSKISFVDMKRAILFNNV